MKKILLSLTLLFVSAVTFAQQQTILSNFDKIKIGHLPAYNDAIEKFTTKFFPASQDGGYTIFDIMGGKHHGEKLRMLTKPLSFAEREVPRKYAEGQVDFWFANIAPHLESVNAEMMVYQPEYSTTKYEEGKDVEKFLMTEWAPIKDNIKQFFNRIDNCNIAKRNNILTLQTKHQIHFNTPIANSFYGDKFGSDLFF